ncbi:MAG: pseudaminic acid synthase [Desulfobacteraceae bacterium]|nr:pseudaminic acid synthase [Desulfobacteraceae bacterium]
MAFEIAGRKTGEGFPVFIIAEVSANHGQDFNRAVSLIKKAKECGADAVKFQAYTPDTMTINIDNEYFRIEHPEWGGQTLYELYKKAYAPWEWFKELKKIAEDTGIIFLCTAFDKTSVDMLEELNICAHKIASFELVDLPLIEYAAKTGKPLIMSTGMADIDEIQEAVDTAKKSGAKEIILLKCVSSYPTKPEEMNLKTIEHMKQLFGCPVGLSDHSMGIGASICTLSLGACIIEKHFTLSRGIKTPDSFFSIEPHELKDLIDNIRIAEKAIGKVHYGLTDEEKKSMIFRRSLFVVKDVKAGEKVSNENIRSIRPGCGLPTKYIEKVIGRTFKKDLCKGTPLNWDLI